MNTHNAANAGSGRATIRTVIVQISRKLKATYRIRSGRRFSDLLLALVAVIAAPVAHALPSGLTVQAGQTTVSTPTANSMVLNQGTNKAILDWQSYSIGAGQSVQYVQPGASSVSLNRVTGGDLSSIYGSLTANGQVFLVNPAGVLFAPGAMVNVGGLVASTLSLSNNDFLAGRYNFSGNGGNVTNQGTITGGYVALAGNTVNNAGAISTPGGAVGLLAGSRVTVDASGAGLVKFSVDGGAVGAAITNSGTIIADGGNVALSAQAIGDTLATVINQSGVIRANTLENHNGTIVLSGGSTGVVSVGGSLQANGAGAGETGGTVKVLGDKVALRSTSRISASGDAGGGTVLVGGGWQGKGEAQNASAAQMASGAQISADAVNSGNGGTVAVWADGSTAVGGAISARGGAQSGNGGRVETSGKESLVVARSTTVDTSAPSGTAGNWLLDPKNIIVAGGGAAALGDVDQFTDTPASDITIDPATINSSAGGVTLQANNDITFVDAVAMANAFSSLTVQAGRSIAVNANVGTNNGALSLTANDSGAIAANRDAGAGTLTIAAGSTVSSGTASTHLVVSDGSTGGALTVNGSVVAGTLLLNNTLGDVNLGGTVAVSGELRAVMDGNLTQTGGSVTAGRLVASIRGSATLTQAANAIDSLGLAGFITFTASGGVSIVDGSGGLIIENIVNAPGGSVSISTVGDLTTNAGTTVSSTGGDISLSATGNVTVNGAVGTTGAGALTVLADSDATGAGALTVGGAVGHAGRGLVTLQGANMTLAGAVAGSNVTLRTSTAGQLIDIGGGDAPGTLGLDATDIGNVSTGGTLTIGRDDATSSGSISVTAALAAGANALVLRTGGGVSQTGGSTINQTNLAIAAGGSVILNEANNVGTLAIQAPGQTVSYTDADAFSIGNSALGAATGIFANSANVVSIGGPISQSQAINVTTLSGAATSATFSNSGNLVDSLNGFMTTGGFSLVDSTGGLTVDATVAGGTGLASISTSGGALDVNSGVSGDTVTLASTDGAITLDSTVVAANTLTLNAGSSISQSAALGADTLTGSAGTSATLNVTTNVIGSLNGFTTGTGFALTDTIGLRVSGAVTGGSGGVSMLAGVIVPGDLTTNAGSAISGATSVTLESVSSDVTTNGTVAVSGAGGTFQVSAGDDANINNTVTVNNGAIDLQAGSFSGTGRVATAVALNAGAGAVTISNNGSTTANQLGGNVTGGSIAITGATNLATDVALSANTGTINTGDIAGGANSLVASASGNAIFGSISANNVTLAGGSLLTTGAVTVTGNYSVTADDFAGGALNPAFIGGTNNYTIVDTDGGLVLGATSAPGTLSVTTQNGDLSIAGATANTGNVNLAAQGGSVVLGGNVGAGGNVDIDGPLLLSANVAISANSGAGTITIDDTTGNGNDLTLTGAATTTGVTGVDALVANQSLATTDAVSATSVAVAGAATLGGNVTTTGAAGQSYGSTTLNADIALNAGAANPISLGAVTGNGRDLTLTGLATTSGGSGIDVLTANQTLTTTGALSATSVAVTGAATLGGNVTTTGAASQSYGATTLTTDVALDAGAANPISLGTITGGNNDLTLTGLATTSGGTGIDVLTANQTLTTTGNLSAASVAVTGAATLGGNVTTTGAAGQSYGSTTLSTDVALDAGAVNPITLNAVTGGGNDLTLTGAATTTGVTGVDALVANQSLATTGAVSATSVAVAGAATLGGNVTTTGAAGQSYGSTTLSTDVALDAGAANPISLGTITGGNNDLTLTGLATTSGGSGIDVLTANQTLTTTGNLSATSMAVAGAATLGGNVTTTGAAGQSYGSTTLTTDVALDAGAANPISLGTITGGNNDLTLTGLATTSGGTGIDALTANQALTTTGALSAASVAVTGAATLGGNVTTTGAAGQSYGSTALTADVALDAGAANPITLGAITGNGNDLTLTGLASTSGGSGLDVLTANQSLTTTGALSATSVAVSGAASLGGNVTTTGAAGQSYGSTTLTADVALDAGAANPITLNAVTGGGNDLTLTGTATTTGVTGVDALVANQTLVTTGAVSATSVAVAGAASLGGNVTTTGAAGQSYGSTMLTTDVALDAGAANPITLNAVTGGGNDLTLTGAAMTTGVTGVDVLVANQSLTTTGAVSATSVAVAGAASLGGNVTTTGAAGQSYGSTTLTTDVALDAGAANPITLGAITGNGNDLTLTGVASTTGGSGLDVLTANQSLTTTGALAANSVSVAGAASLGGDVTTTGTQAYAGSVTLSNDVALQSTGNGAITMASLAGGNNDLALNTTGGVTSNGAVTGVDKLTLGSGTDLAASSVSTNAADLAGNVSTSAGQTYGGAVTLNGGVTLADSGSGNVTFNGTIDGGQALTVTTGGTTAFMGTVGGTTALASLATNGGGTTDINASVTTTGAQTYADNVVLSTDVALAGSGIAFQGTVAGAGHDLTLQTPGTASFTSASGIDDLNFGGGSLDSIGTLTATRYNMQGGTVNALLGAGTLNVQGNTALNGTSAASAVNVTGGTLTLGSGANRLTNATTVAIDSGATLDTGSASQQLGATSALAAVTNNGTLVVPVGLTAASVSSPGVLQTGANAVLNAQGAISAANDANTIGENTSFNLGGTLNVTGDFAGAVQVDGFPGGARSTDVTLTDTSASTLTVAKMQVAPTASVTLVSPQRLVVNTPQLSPVRLLTVNAPNIMFEDSDLAITDGSPGVIATEKIDVTITPEGSLNTPEDPMYIHPRTPSIVINGVNPVAKNYWIAGNVGADVVTARVLGFSVSAVSAIYAETARFLRTQQRADAGLLGLENLVLFANLPLDAVVAPLSFPSLLIREPRCLDAQRKGEADCR